MCENNTRTQKTSAWTKRTFTWIWIMNIYLLPLAILPKTVDVSGLMTSRYNTNQENRILLHRHSFDEQGLYGLHSVSASPFCLN